MDVLVIAPTAGWTRDRAQIQINDTIKDRTDAVNVKQKIDKLIPDPSDKSPRDATVNVHHDMRSIHLGAGRADVKARQQIFREDADRDKLETSYPTTGNNEQNLRHIQGLNSF